MSLRQKILSKWEKNQSFVNVIFQYLEPAVSSLHVMEMSWSGSSLLCDILHSVMKAASAPEFSFGFVSCLVQPHPGVNSWRDKPQYRVNNLLHLLQRFSPCDLTSFAKSVIKPSQKKKKNTSFIFISQDWTDTYIILAEILAGTSDSSNQTQTPSDCQMEKRDSSLQRTLEWEQRTL